MIFLFYNKFPKIPFYFLVLCLSFFFFSLTLSSPSFTRSLARCPAPRRRPLPPLESPSSARQPPEEEGVSGEEGCVEGEGELEGGRGSRGKRGEVATARAPPAADVAGAAASGSGDLGCFVLCARACVRVCVCVCVLGGGTKCLQVSGVLYPSAPFPSRRLQGPPGG